MVSGAISDSDTYVGGTWFVRFRSVVRTASVRGRYVVRTASVRGRYVVRTTSVRGSSVVGTISDRTSISPEVRITPLVCVFETPVPICLIPVFPGIG